MQIKNESFRGQNISELDEVNDFNIRSRYPEFKFRFYKKCTKRFTEKYIDRIEQLFRYLCQHLQQKK